MSRILAAGAARMKLEAENYEARIAALEAQLAELAAENERLKQRLANHQRDTSAVDAHETANVSDKPEGQQEPVANDPVANHWPEAHEVADILSENKGFWRACSGCHETNEGHPTGPRSMVLGCNLGHGCHECGGIGAIWDTTDYTDMGDYLAQEFTRPSEQAVTEAWREIKQHVQPRIADGYTAVAISKPGYWLVKGPGPATPLKAAMEAGG